MRAIAARKSEPSGSRFAWAPYVLYPTEIENGRLQPEIVKVALVGSDEIQILEVWPVDVIVKSLVVMASQLRISETAGGAQARRSELTFGEIEQWIQQTKAVAARMPFGGGVREQMVAAAMRIEALQAWPQRFFASPPRSPREQTLLRQSCLLWALDTLRRAIDESEAEWAKTRGASAHLNIPGAGYWAALFRPVADLLPEKFCDEGNINERVRRLQQRVKVGAAGALMAEILSEATRHGPFTHDGQPRP
jgi:hypothetical protein